eukprot:8202935-Heterocapsa_arctica.AAC.1
MTRYHRCLPPQLPLHQPTGRQLSAAAYRCRTLPQLPAAEPPPHSSLARKTDLPVSTLLNDPRASIHAQ